MTVVVVGAGIAGVRLVQELRQRGSTEPVIVIGAERHRPYDRPPLSKQVLQHKRDLPELVTAEDWHDLGADLRLGVTAEGLDIGGNLLLTDQGSVPYSSLVIATGSEPVRMPQLGGQVLRTFDEAIALRDNLRPGSALAVVGAGLIGCEVAASARAAHVLVHLIDVLPSPMYRVVGSGLAEQITDLHRRNGVHLHLGTGVRSHRHGVLTLEDETTILADMIVQAIGARPQVSWLAGTGLDGPDGVPCDQFGRTVHPNVFAVGDVACVAGRRSEHWTAATEQAAAVAALLTGQNASAVGPSYWWSDQYEVKFQGLGSVTDADEVRLHHWGPSHRPIALYGRAGRIVGVVGMSAAGGVMSTRADIEAGASLDEVSSRFG